MTKEIENKLIVFLFSAIPISIIIGQAISLINIFLISILIILIITLSKNYNFIYNQSIILLFALYLYLLLNTLISIDYSLSISRNFGFIRLIFLFIAINYFFFYFKNQETVFKIWFLIISIVIIDSLIEYFTGKNILGFGHDNYADRIVSFFKDEPIVGGYLNGFFFLILGYLFNMKSINSKKLIILCLLFTFLFLICLTLTGERSNTIKAIIGLIIFFSLSSKFNIKQKLITFLSFTIIITTIISNSNYLKYRYLTNLILPLLNADKRETREKLDRDKLFKQNLYLKHYRSGYSVFKNYPLFGVGNKNYRLEVNRYHLTKKNYIPDTHPHQIYFEFLSEHGLIGTLILILILFFLIFKNIKNCLISKNSLQLGAFCYLFISLLPFLPSGSFFNDFNITLFFLNFSILFASNPSSNIFNKKV